MDEVQQSIMQFMKREILYSIPDDLDEHTSLIANRLVDSLGLMKVVLFLEEKFEIMVPPSALTPQNFETVNSIADMVRNIQAACA